MSRTKTMPKSESRRKYFSALIREIQALTGYPYAEAKAAASAVLLLMQHRVKNGKTLDFGFLKVVPKTVKPMTITCNLLRAKGGKSTQIHMGETVRWTVKVVKSWQRKNRPAWSRYS